MSGPPGQAALPIAEGFNDIEESKPELPPPTMEEVAFLNGEMNSQQTYTQSADVLKRLVMDLLEQGGAKRALGFIDGENILIQYMKDDLLVELLRDLIGKNEPILFKEIMRRIASPSAVETLLADEFDKAMKDKNLVRARAIADVTEHEALASRFKAQIDRTAELQTIEQLFHARRFEDAFAEATVSVNNSDFQNLVTVACVDLIKKGDVETVVQQLLPHINKLSWNESVAVALVKAADTVPILKVVLKNLIECKPQQKDWDPSALQKTLTGCGKRFAFRLRKDLVELVQRELLEMVPEEDRERKDCVPPSHMCCPIALSLMRDPLLSPHGHNFERRAISSWLAHRSTCPMTRQPLEMKQLKPNTQLREEIGQWRQSHLNGSLINGVDAANREMEIHLAAGHLAKGDSSASATVLQSFAVGPARVTAVQECVKIALSSQDGLNIDLKPCLDEVFGILGNSATALSSRLLVLAQLIQHNSKWSYGNTKCALPRTEVMLRFAAEEAVRYFFVAYFQAGEDFVVKNDIVEHANKITKKMRNVECNRLRMELELEGGMSNDDQLFPFEIGNTNF